MGLRYLKERDKRFEPFKGAHPGAVLDEHVGGEFIAMQVTLNLEVLKERAAVWSTKTRKIVWKPENVNAICWTPTGDEILFISESYRRASDHPQIIVTPLQSEYSRFFERCSWPDLKPVARCPIKLPTGWPIDLVASPTSTLACCVWLDQGEAGIELVSIHATQVRQLSERGYFGRRSNLLQGPVFSGDGRYLVFTFGNPRWWSPDDELETPSPGGEHTVGWIIVGDMQAASYREIEVKTVLPKGWLPPDPQDMTYEMLPCPSFLDADHFTLTLPTGEERSFSASACQI